MCPHCKTVDGTAHFLFSSLVERERLNSHSEKTKFQLTLLINLRELQAQHM